MSEGPTTTLTGEPSQPAVATTMNHTTQMYLSLDIEGFISAARFPDGYRIFDRTDGTEMSPVEARTFLAIELAKGRKVIPCSSECSAPCKHSASGCTGFDYKGGGCPGHRVDDAQGLTK